MDDRRTNVPACFFVGVYSASMAAECTVMASWRGFVGTVAFSLLAALSFWAVMVKEAKR